MDLAIGQCRLVAKEHVIYTNIPWHEICRRCPVRLEARAVFFPNMTSCGPTAWKNTKGLVQRPVTNYLTMILLSSNRMSSWTAWVSRVAAPSLAKASEILAQLEISATLTNFGASPAIRPSGIGGRWNYISTISTSTSITLAEKLIFWLQIEWCTAFWLDTTTIWIKG